MNLRYTLYFLTLILSLTSCKKQQKAAQVKEAQFITIIDQPKQIASPNNMVWVKGKSFIMGAKPGDQYAMHREMPAHQVAVDGFFIDIHEVTNKQFAAFVKATDYKTVAERPIDWEEMKKELPEGTEKPHDSILQPGCMIFNKNVKSVANMENYGQWWSWKTGVNWMHPQGEDSDIIGKDNFPVIHIAYEDAVAYCKWANRRLPTEAEWESAAQGNQISQIYTWGDDSAVLNDKANTWQGTFPTTNEPKDGFAYIAPIKSYEANDIGLYDMLGNVWEWTSDWYDLNYYKNLDSLTVNPMGPAKAYNPMNPYQQEKIIKGGSYLCHDSYCASFRISAKMPMTRDSGSDHVGFRTVATVDMLEGE